jgi:hypothetical protein
MDTTELQKLKRRLSNAADFLGRKNQKTGARAVRAAIFMVAADEANESSVADAYRYLMNLVPWVQSRSDMTVTMPKLVQALEVMKTLAMRPSHQSILDTNKLLNDKCEKLMDEVKRLEYAAGERPEYTGPDTKAGEVVQLKGAELNPDDMKGIPVQQPIGDLSVWLKEIETHKTEVERLKGELAVANNAFVEQGSVIRGLKDELSRVNLESKRQALIADELTGELDEEKASVRKILNIATILAERL